MRFFPIDFNPMVVACYAPESGNDAKRILMALIGDGKFNLAKRAHKENVILLKFAGSHVAKLKEIFKTVKVFCKIENFFELVYGRCK